MRPAPRGMMALADARRIQPVRGDAMDDQAPEREYPYHYGKEFLGCFSIAGVLLALAAAFFFYEVATSSQSVVIEKGPGRIELTGNSARTALVVVGVIAVLLLAGCVQAIVAEARKSW